VRLVFWDQSFHKKTNSSEFFLRLINPNVEVMRRWDDRWQGGEQPDVGEIDALNPDVVIFFQAIPPAHELLKLRCPTKIWVPMWDSVWFLPDRAWLPYLVVDIKIVSFCTALHEKVSGLGFKSFYIQYFPRPSVKVADDEGSSIFFWHRRSDINWSVVRALLNDSDIKTMFYKRDPDPNCTIDSPSDIDIGRFNIQTIEGWISKREYMECLGRCNVFIAPRAYEGIGLANLEAMSRGLCVVSPDYPTANEYIKDGVSGFLYDIENPPPIDLSTANRLGHSARQSISDGYGRWENDKKKIQDLINQRI